MTTYDARVAKRLSEVYASATVDAGRELADLRLIVFSDLHKGQRDDADDFAACEPAYLAALDHYWREGFELFLLGDVEELWESRPSSVIDKYSGVLKLEQPFAAAASPSRYTRFVGNHDDLWYSPSQVQDYLARYLAGQPVIESLRMTVHQQGQPLGELFFLHGHQGTSDSDRFARVSAWAVRNLWRPLQRLFNVRSNTPSTNYELRGKHELAMYHFAASRPGLVLFAGHTHHPIWEGLNFKQALEMMGVRGLEVQVDAAWVQEQVAEAVALPDKPKPSYFNSGCCAYRDGSITGIELSDGQVRLVRWAGTPPARTEVFSASLQDVLAAVAG
ncbi:MAG TPA: metallophosphoesterase [Anaerolineae bacterium]|nr:metallophosphoesterase [Anaerolineae bacterium]HNU04186.1 metallophosphoesterase [Anaerolineae bacterium]